jgi:hypothetical protein
MLAVGGIYSVNGGTNARNLSIMPSVVNSVYSVVVWSGPNAVARSGPSAVARRGTYLSSYHSP